MQQTMSFLGLTVPMPAQAAAQIVPKAAASAVPAGLFEQLLAGVLQGIDPPLIAPAAPLATQVQQGAPTRQSAPAIPVDPAVLALTGKLQAEPQAPAVPVGSDPIPVLSLTGLILRPPAPAEGKPAPASEGQLPAEPVPAVTTAATDETETEPETETLAPLPEAPAVTMQPVPAPSQMAVVTAAAQTVLAQPAPTQPVPPRQAQPGAQAQPQALSTDLTGEGEAPVDPRVLRFVQKAAAVVAREGAAPEPAPGATGSVQPGPTFSDLVDLVQKLEQPASAESPVRPEPKPEQPAAEVAQSLPEQPVVEVGRPQAAPVETAQPASEAPEVQRQPVDPESVVRQVTRSVKVMLDGKRSEVQLQLNPEHLGKVAVRLVLSEGTVQANITARDASVRAALESGLEQLKIRFQEQGLKVDHVNVSVGSDSGFTQFHQSPQDQPRHQNQQGQPAGRQPQWRANQEPEQHRDEPQNRKASPRMWGYGRTGARINSLA